MFCRRAGWCLFSPRVWARVGVCGRLVGAWRARVCGCVRALGGCLFSPRVRACVGAWRVWALGGRERACVGAWRVCDCLAGACVVSGARAWSCVRVRVWINGKERGGNLSGWFRPLSSFVLWSG